MKPSWFLPSQGNQSRKCKQGCRSNNFLTGGLEAQVSSPCSLPSAAAWSSASEIPPLSTAPRSGYKNTSVAPITGEILGPALWSSLSLCRLSVCLEVTLPSTQCLAIADLLPLLSRSTLPMYLLSPLSIHLSLNCVSVCIGIWGVLVECLSEGDWKGGGDRSFSSIWLIVLSGGRRLVIRKTGAVFYIIQKYQ